MPYGKGAFIDAYWFKLGIEDTVIEHVKSNTGYGSGRAGISPHAAIFFKKGATVGERYFRAVNGYDLPPPYAREARVEIQGIPAAQEGPAYVQSIP